MGTLVLRRVLPGAPPSTIKEHTENHKRPASPVTSQAQGTAALRAWPSTQLRDKLNYANFGSATIKTTDKGDRFRNLLNAAKPAGIPFNPWA
ncbi:hypothetical protein ACFYT4_32825 [Streptomyces sp. NPDC004609]|uniref:hypothetical protein n=1 Tax=Streptomyces sp. NPDC004609 TaxID=3364704 RepID=UPI00368842BC